jgi:hypothetical protein
VTQEQGILFSSHRHTEGTRMGFPTTLREFQVTFPDEKACWKALRKARWPRGFEYPRRGHRESSWISTRGLEQCRGYRYQCSVTAGMVLLRTWAGRNEAGAADLLGRDLLLR